MRAPSSAARRLVGALLTLPPGVALTSARDEAPLTYVDGYVPMTPIQVRVFYERSDLTVILSEDEVYESELLVTDGVHRTFIKTLARCELGSDFVAVVAPEAAGAQVPVPAGRSDTPSPASPRTPSLP